MSVRIVLLAGVVSVFSTSAFTTSSGLIYDGTGVAQESSPRYNQVQQKSSHNSFQRKEGLIDQIVYHNVRSLELDIHRSKGGPDLDRDWYVYHVDRLDDYSSCPRLSECLEKIQTFHQTFPGHEVLTIMVDVKDNFGGSQSAQDLDLLLGQYFPGDEIFRPIDLKRRCRESRTLNESVRGTCQWPTLQELKGRLIFVLTGRSLDLYVGEGRDTLQRTAFIAPLISSRADLGNANAVFFNFNIISADVGQDVHQSNYVGRVFTIKNQRAWDRAVSRQVHHIATNKVNYYKDDHNTHNRFGWPFACMSREINAPCQDFREGLNFKSIEIQSGPISSRSDSFGYLFKRAGAEINSWTAFVGVPSSWVRPSAAGCLMARQSTDPSSPFFAVCRPADEAGPFVLVRQSAGAEVEHTGPPPSINFEEIGFLQLQVTNGGKTVQGFASWNGRDNWMPVSSAVTFSQPLTLQGAAATSDDLQRKLKLLFGNLTLNGRALGPVGQFDLKGQVGRHAVPARIFDGTFSPQVDRG